MTRKSDRWTVDDVVDFEWLAAEGGGPAATAPTVAAAARAGDRRTTFRAWLAEAREASPAVLPGTIYRRGRRTLVAALISLGALSGAGLAGQLLARAGVEPVNAPLFFGWTVGLQLAILALVGIGVLLRTVGLRFGLLRDVLLFAVGAFGWIASRLDGRRRSEALAGWATLHARSGRLAPLVGCQLLIATQLFAIAFNLGAIAVMTLVYLPFEELRFGWQSTYSITADGVAAGVHGFARPWLWFSDTLAPTAAEVAATRYTRGQPAASLPAAASHAWWPFLISAIAFYGLAIRTVLWAVATLILRARLGRLRFVHPAADALWRRIEGPLFRATGEDDRLPNPQAGARTSRTRGVDVLIVDDELRAARSALEQALGAVGRVVHAAIDNDVLSDDLITAVRGDGITAVRTVVVAAPASRDPIVAIAGFLRALSATAGPATTVTLMLVAGPPRPDDRAALDERLAIWTRFAAIHRLNVGLELAT